MILRCVKSCSEPISIFNTVFVLVFVSPAMELVYVFTTCFCSFISTAYSLSTFSGVKLEENGYNGVVVGISSDVPENPRLVEIIKEMFNNASSDLYQATKGRAYFRDVTILIPQTWTGDQWDLGPPNITYKNIDVTITQSHNALEDGAVDLPYTKQFEGCGKPGVSIYMTSQFVQQHQKVQHLYGNYGQILVHEWGHYRWGLFDEYPNEATEGKNPESFFYFSTKTQRWRPIGCSNQWEMVAVKRIETSNSGAEYGPTYITCEGNDVSGYEEGCVALPSARHGSINGSIMEGNLKFQRLPMFCDSDPNDPATMHNAEAPNRQNLECGGRSTWEVMREHEDFNDGKNPPRIITNLTPSFNVIRARPPRVIFVIDNSNEMRIDDRMSKVTTAFNCFIKSMIPDRTLAGLVVFDRQAYVLHGLQEIDRADPEGKFENWFKVNVSRETHSSVESGVIAGMKLLSQQNDNGGGKVVVITTDKGGNSSSMGVAEGQYTQQGIVIDVLIYNDAEADIFDIVDATGRAPPFPPGSGYAPAKYVPVCHTQLQSCIFNL
ncbi:Calcium-activated chloride channel regulator 1 [Holothuria leucospilota]|uniref:Calcium-activated chloride channel regulator 1 n=1 Tax=Holothuria leucospilota TaxID=206669 RepID=A0A9Q1BKK4_HOLLE|nr:Calcium-activated chloride channel regulator 1 [Holothuria leucospilota]